jgi:hypothetical protein
VSQRAKLSTGEIVVDSRAIETQRKAVVVRENVSSSSRYWEHFGKAGKERIWAT